MADAPAGLPALTPEAARELALILQSGMPVSEAVLYFLPEGTPAAEARVVAERWQKSPALGKAVSALQGKSWQHMSLEEKMGLAVSKHYAEMAYFLYSRNYSELQGADKTKADTCREAIERKLTGTAGQQDPLTRFLADVQSGRIKLGQPVAALPTPAPQVPKES